MADRFYISPTADSVPFDNDTNGFVADNVQDAIEEARTSAIGNLLKMDFVSSGNTANKWLGYVNSAAPSDQIPFVLPQDTEVKGFTFSNRDNNVDTDVRLYKNGSLIFTWEVRNKRTAYKVGIAGPINFAQGDRMSVYLKKYTQGSGDSTAQDPLVEVLAKLTDEQQAEGGTQNSV